MGIHGIEEGGPSDLGRGEGTIPFICVSVCAVGEGAYGQVHV